MIKYPEHMVFGLDIGTRNLVGTVGFRENEHLFRVAAQCVLEHETRAMMDGQIHDIGKVSESIQKLKKQLETQVGRELNDVCIAAAGRVLKTLTVSAYTELPEETVIKSEHINALDMLGVEKAYEQIRRETGSEDIPFYCVGYSVIHYYLNDYPMTKLEGHKAAKIGADMIATFLPQEVIDGLYASVEGAGLQVENLTLEPIAAINVAIPEKFRLLNIALVDVGAGTSDICITKDGSIIAYGMIPHAGDEITEELARRYLVDFNTAEKIKQDSLKKKDVTFKDIMGLKQKVPAAEVKGVIRPIVENITKEVGAKIRELNGGKAVSAVFIVGGGGKVAGFTEMLAENLQLPKERVALRGEEVLGEVEFLQEGVKKDPLLVTPIGICYSYYESRNNFIYVQVNGERVKLYDNSKLTIVDAAMQVGFPNEDLFPKRGEALHFTVDGVKKVLRGEPGDAAVITLNGNPAAISSRIDKNDRIQIEPSTAGEAARCEIQSLPEYSSSILCFTFNGKKVECPKFVQVNGSLVSGFYEIQSGDEVEIRSYYTLEQVLEFMDLPYKEGIQVNHQSAGPQERVYENFSVDYDVSITGGADSQEIDEQKSELPEKTAEQDMVASDEKGVTEQESAVSAPVSTEPITLDITVNGTPIHMSGKPRYIMVDVLDYYPFDMSEMRGDGLEQRINGVEVQGFMDELHQGDQILLRWKE